MNLSTLSIADSPSPVSDQDYTQGTSHLSPKLRDKLNKLAKWRIDPALIEFPEDTREFEGGHAIVSRALLNPTLAAATGPNQPTNAEGGHKSDGQKAIAVKRLKIQDDGDRERILSLALREAGFLVGLSSSFIIKLEGYVEDLPNNRIWLAFPWHEHGNLKDFVASQDWEIPERICLIFDVTLGVEYLHSRDPPIYHGDLKSINVLVNSNCRALITDFGSARRLTKKDVAEQTTRTEKKAQPAPEFQATFCATSNTMTFTGNEYTLRWAAPELLMDDEPTLASDIWALGWIFYEVMTNSIPFENVKKDSMIIKHVIDGKLPCVTDHIRMSLILRLSSLMVACWYVDPTERPTAESCRKLMDWMPLTIPRPVPQQVSDAELSRARSPELLMKLGDMHKDQDDWINASNLYTEALAIYNNNSDDAGMAGALYGLGQTHWQQSKHSESATFYSKALNLYTDIGNRDGRALALWGLAKVHSDQEEYDEAITLYSEVIQISIETGSKERKAYALRGLADVYRLQEDYDQAVPSYTEAIEIFTILGDVLGRSNALAGLAYVKRLQAMYTEAASLFAESLKLSTDIGDRHGRAFALFGLAAIHCDQDRPHDALSLFEEAAEIFGQIGAKNNAAAALAEAAGARSRLEGLKTG